MYLHYFTSFESIFFNPLISDSVSAGSHLQKLQLSNSVAEMFSVCRQSHPATAVEHAITCHFFNRTERSLVVAGSNVLRVFRLVPDTLVDKNEAKRGMPQKCFSVSIFLNLFSKLSLLFYCLSARGPPVMKLECLATYQLFGNVMSLQAVSLAGSGRDALLMSFRDAKLSVVEYDLDSNTLKTLSLHYFEEEDMRVCYATSFVSLTPFQLSPLHSKINSVSGWMDAPFSYSYGARGP